MRTRPRVAAVACACLISVLAALTGTLTTAATPGSTGRAHAVAAPPPPVSPPSPPPAPHRVRANELGVVPVLMYHRIRRHPDQDLDRTPRQLRRELTRLAEEGYVPITAAALARGEIDVPAGRHPVVLTFDDSDPSQFALDARGRPKRDTAVAILLAVAARHPGFRPVATFYVYENVFQLEGAARAEALRWLRGHGFEVGNHTLGHVDLGRLSRREAAAQLVRMQRLARRLGGGTPATLALPFGSRTREPGWARSGGFGGERYRFAGVFLAGYEPAPSPFAKKFDPGAIPRIRSGGRGGDCGRYCSLGWLNRLKRHPGERFTSDGDPGTISFPRTERKRLAAERNRQVRPY